MTDFLSWWADRWPLVPVCILTAIFTLLVFRWLLMRAIWDAFEIACGPPTAINGKPTSEAWRARREKRIERLKRRREAGL